MSHDRPSYPFTGLFRAAPLHAVAGWGVLALGAYGGGQFMGAGEYLGAFGGVLLIVASLFLLRTAQDRAEFREVTSSAN